MTAQDQLKGNIAVVVLGVVVVFVQDDCQNRYTGDRPQERANDRTNHEKPSHNDGVSHVWR